QAIETRQIMDAPVEVTIEGSRKPDADLLVGRSAGVLNVYKQIGRVARQDVTVLIRGESGTGKELVARAIYQHSRRAGRPFLAVNCAALTDSLLESELFGHEKGSFTGADQRRIGKFEQCHGGTIFLDEVGDMSAVLQSKVLRVLQEQKFERVGGNKTIETDVRVIAATNRDLEKMVTAGTFRSDLYYRLNGVTIELPPLRRRDGDVMLLVEHFIARFRGEMGKEQVQGVAPKTVELLRNYSWPGNIRELQSVVRQALMNSTGPVLVPEFLPEEVRQGRRSRPASPTRSEPGRDPKSDLQGFVERQLAAGSDNLYADALELMERYVLTRVLEKTDGNQSQAAKILGITRGSLRNKIRSLGISIGQVISVGSDDSEEE
ncbi:MAG: sigma-54 interaction domain-containing protein, partial [Planctomycetaceae bacterium]